MKKAAILVRIAIAMTGAETGMRWVVGWHDRLRKYSDSSKHASRTPETS
jgi:hypothetical protein